MFPSSIAVWEGSDCQRDASSIAAGTCMEQLDMHLVMFLHAMMT